MKTDLSFSALFEGHIWRIFPNTTFSIVLEIRNYETRTVSFSLLDLEKKGIAWSNYMLKENWWVGIEAVKDGHILFHGYNHIQYANHLGITCLSTETKEIVWEHKNLIFHSVIDNKIIAQRKDQGFSANYLEIDFKKGEITREFEGIIRTPEEKFEGVFYPMKYDDLDEGYSKIIIFLEKKINVKAVFSAEYLEFEGYIIISFYTKSEDKLQNRLILFDSEANIILDMILDQNLDGIGIQTFSVMNRKLVFVQNKKELKIYDL